MEIHRDPWWSMSLSATRTTTKTSIYYRKWIEKKKNTNLVPSMQRKLQQRIYDSRRVLLQCEIKSKKNRKKNVKINSKYYKEKVLQRNSFSLSQ